MKWVTGMTLRRHAAGCAIAAPAFAQETTPAMVAAAEKEGKVVWYTAVDVKVAEAVAKVFRAEYPKIAIEVERSGSERVFQRINQEYAVEHQERRRREFVGRLALPLLEAAEAARRAHAARRAAVTPRSIKDADGYYAFGARRCR